MRGYPDHLMHGPRLIGGGFTFLMSLLIVGLLVYLVILLRRDRNGAAAPTYTPAAPTEPSSPGLLTPTEVVKMRYARGEITREEYETIRKDLE
jgi:uncharacterized membrane protein